MLITISFFKIIYSALPVISTGKFWPGLQHAGSKQAIHIRSQLSKFYQPRWKTGFMGCQQNETPTCKSGKLDENHPQRVYRC